MYWVDAFIKKNQKSNVTFWTQGDLYLQLYDFPLILDFFFILMYGF